MEEKKVSIAEMLQMTVDELEGISIPVKYADQISRPIYQAVLKIRICIEAMAAEPAEEQEEKQDGDSKGI